jgi:hypothetical protein
LTDKRIAPLSNAAFLNQAVELSQIQKITRQNCRDKHFPEHYACQNTSQFWNKPPSLGLLGRTFTVSPSRISDRY